MDFHCRFSTVRQLNPGRNALVLLALVMGVATAHAQQAPDPRIADLVQAGKLRVALFPPQYRKDPATGEIRRNLVYSEVARELARRLGIELLFIHYTTPVEVMEALRSAACDVAVMAIDSSRAAHVDFSPPFTQLDFTYLVPPASAIRTAADADRPGVRIAAVRDHGSTVALRRVIKNAKLAEGETPDAAFDLLRTGDANAFAAPRLGLLRYVAHLPGSRVLDDRYGGVSNAVAIAKGQPGRLAYISEFIEEVKASGFVQRAIERAGEAGVQVSPPGAITGQQ